ncbi:MAG: hypothetical protein ACRDJC_12050 [Thermomicrobiales bacterium]
MNRTCTASTSAHLCCRGRLTVVIWLAVLSLCAPFAPSGYVVLADIELGHEGLTGRHRLADMHDSPGAVCDIVLPGRESLGETWLRVNPPVMFARDRTDAVDEQSVGWRATVSALNDDTGAWRIVKRSGTTRELATDDLASYFNGQGWLAEFPLSRATYSVSVEMLWYDPDDSRRIEGRATHAIEHFSILLRHDGETMHGRTASVCRAPR